MSEQLPSSEDVRATLLDALHYEDDQGLWEIVWTLNVSNPAASQASKVALARDVVFGLVDEGRVRMRTAPWPAAADTGRALTDEELDRLRTDPVPWADPGEFIVWLCKA